MAKKLKFTPGRQHRQNDLFDLTGDLFASDENQTPAADDVHSPLTGMERLMAEDFTVNAPASLRNSAPVTPDDVMALRREEIKAVRKLRFISFGSGSSGNCAYLGDERGGVLIDAGVEPDKVREALNFHGLSMKDVKGVCLTHDHSDHVRFVYSLVRKYTHIGVYCTPKVLSGLLRRHSISRRIKDYHHPIYKEFPFQVAGFEITAFGVEHDGTDCCGFYFVNDDLRFAVATDLGGVNDRVDYYLRRARFVMIEANYDLTMLRNGPYPMHLKARIEGPAGHLDNMDTGRFLKSIYTPDLTHVFLCHLSNENNTPEAALSAVTSALLEAGAQGVGDGSGSIESRQCAVQLVALPRYDASPLYTFR